MLVPLIVRSASLLPIQDDVTLTPGPHKLHWLLENDVMLKLPAAERCNAPTETMPSPAAGGATAIS